MCSSIGHECDWGECEGVCVWCMARLVGVKDHRLSVDGW